MIDVIILGSTGSIGTQALEVIREHPEQFRVLGLAAGGANLDLLSEQILEFHPQRVALGGKTPARSEAGLLEALRLSGVRPGDSRMPEILAGSSSVETLASFAPQATVLNGITGGVGLGATLAALQAGSKLALANKESLVVGGALVKQAQVFPGQVVPVDSEHSAIAQSLLAGVHEKGMTSPVVTGRSEVAELVLTASGGPFRGRKASELTGIRAKDALAHPTWQMGPVVTVNSSTLMNKGLELIEAALLFDLPVGQITPIIHPQSIVHSAVTWQDGATILQASPPDMKIPIALGLTWGAEVNSSEFFLDNLVDRKILLEAGRTNQGEELHSTWQVTESTKLTKVVNATTSYRVAAPYRLPAIAKPLTWSEASQWTFEPIDHQTFPALELAKQVLEASPTHPAVMNAANEVCVQAFLEDKIQWLDIMSVVTQVVQEHEGSKTPDLTEILAATKWASGRATELLNNCKG